MADLHDIGITTNIVVTKLIRLAFRASRCRRERPWSTSALSQI